MNAVEPPFPIVRVSSPDPFERGRLIGEGARERIYETVAQYGETFAHYTDLSWAEATVFAERFRDPIAAYDESILDEIDGIAAGAGLQPADILALNARTEIMFGLSEVAAAECTSFFAGSTITASGKPLLGQNWDWRPRAANSTTLFEIDPVDRPAFLMVAEAGLVGKLGFNSAGVGMVMNTLISGIDKGDPGVPSHVVMRAVLSAADIEEAVAAVVRSRRASSANLLIADANGTAVNLEAGPGGIENLVMTHPEGDIITHSNHFVCSRPFPDLMPAWNPDSLERIDRMRELIEAQSGAVTAETMTEILSDHDSLPGAICCHPDDAKPVVERFMTVASWILDLSSLTVRIAAGNPCENEYQLFEPAFASGSSVDSAGEPISAPVL
jgi:isopenicillin-N N-acyltransferase-like protein